MITQKLETSVNVSNHPTNTFYLKRRSVEEVFIAAVVVIALVGLCIQLFFAENFVLIAAALFTAIVGIGYYILQADTLKQVENNNFVLTSGWFFNRKSISIESATISFVGIAGSELFPKIGKRHQVYIIHGDVITPIRLFVAGREAVLFAKALKKFIET